MPFYEDTPLYKQIFYNEGLADLLWSLEFTVVNQKSMFREWCVDVQPH